MLIIVNILSRPILAAPVECGFDEDQPPFSTCTIRQADPTETGYSFDIVPVEYPANVSRFLLSVPLELKTFPRNVFKKLPGLLVLLLENAGIETLDHDSFELGSNLLTLLLAENKIEKIPSGVFAELESLEILELNKNRIQIIEDNAFSGLVSLRELSLENNRIRTLGALALAGATNLRELHLAYNDMEVIDEGSLNLPNLRMLGLGYNRLKSVPDHMCTHSPKLGTISIWNNEITHIRQTFYNCHSLEFLYMDNNLIEDVDFVALSALEKLDSFTLSNNSMSFKTSPTNTNTNSSSNSPVSAIFLNSNRLSDPNIFKKLTMFPNLESIFLLNNQFTHFDDLDQLGTLFPKLNHIDITNNTADQWVKENEVDIQHLNITIVIV